MVGCLRLCSTAEHHRRVWLAVPPGSLIALRGADETVFARTIRLLSADVISFVIRVDQFSRHTIAVAVAYFLAARLSLYLLTEPDGVAVFWPAAGVSAGALICLGRAARLPVLAGTMAATIAANLMGDRNIWSAIVFAFFNAGEAALVSVLIERYFGAPFNLDKPRNVVGLLIAASVATAISGIGGTAGFELFHYSSAPL